MIDINEIFLFILNASLAIGIKSDVEYFDVIRDFVSLVCKGLNNNIYKEMKIVQNYKARNRKYITISKNCLTE